MKINVHQSLFNVKYTSRYPTYSLNIFEYSYNSKFGMIFTTRYDESTMFYSWNLDYDEVYFMGLENNSETVSILRMNED